MRARVARGPDPLTTHPILASDNKHQNCYRRLLSAPGNFVIEAPAVEVKRWRTPVQGPIGIEGDLRLAPAHDPTRADGTVELDEVCGLNFEYLWNRFFGLGEDTVAIFGAWAVDWIVLLLHGTGLLTVLGFMPVRWKKCRTPRRVSL